MAGHHKKRTLAVRLTGDSGPSRGAICFGPHSAGQVRTIGSVPALLFCGSLVWFPGTALRSVQLCQCIAMWVALTMGPSGLHPAMCKGHAAHQLARDAHTSTGGLRFCQCSHVGGTGHGPLWPPSRILQGATLLTSLQGMLMTPRGVRKPHRAQCYQAQRSSQALGALTVFASRKNERCLWPIGHSFGFLTTLAITSWSPVLAVSSCCPLPDHQAPREQPLAAVCGVSTPPHGWRG